MEPSAPRTLSTADARREAVLAAAMHVFAQRGFSGTPTTEVAKAAGISHAYLFRLFPTKSDLAVAVAERCHERIHRAFAEASARAKAAGEDPMDAMAAAYAELISDDELLKLQLHSHAAAAGDPAVRAASAAGFGRIVDLVKEQTGAPDEEVGRFIATGMLMNVVAALGAMDSTEPWACTLRAMKDKD